MDLAPDELTAEMAEKLLAEPSGDRELGVDPDSGLAIVAKSGRYGPYVTEVLPEGSPKSAKPRTGSLFTDMTLSTITLDDALRLLSLPRVVGVDPADGVEITAQNGRYGPYLLKDKDSRSLAGEEQIFTVDLERGARAVRAAEGHGAAGARPSRRCARSATTRPPALPIVVKDGRFGPYVTDGVTNASLRTADDPATVTVERASDLLSERRVKESLEGGAPKKTTKRVVKKAAAKRVAAKKTTTAKKTAAKKTAAKKTAAAGTR